MNTVTFPLNPHTEGAAVADLQDALALCLADGALLAADPATRAALQAALQHERATQTYADATTRAVGSFQKEQGLHATGAVDEATAKALNALVQRLAQSDEAQAAQVARNLVVSGLIKLADGRGVPGVAVRAEHVGAAAAIELASSVTDAGGRYTIRYDGLSGIDGLALRVSALDAEGKPWASSDIVPGARSPSAIDIVVPPTQVRTRRVTGVVGSASRAAVEGLRIVIVDKGVGGDVTLAETTTGSGGAFSAVFDDAAVQQRGKALPDLQSRAYAGDVFLGASDVAYDVIDTEVTHVVLLDESADAKLGSEHEALTAAIARCYPGKPADLQESAERQDITYLANKTGWDARAVAMAALADQFGARSSAGDAALAIEPHWFYALFRAGLPADPDALFRANSGVVAAAWQSALTQGVVPAAAAGSLDDRLARFRGLAAKAVLAAPAQRGVSSAKELLTAAGLNDAQQANYAALCIAHSGDLAGLWGAVAGALPDKAARLQVDARLGLLTVQNAALIQRLHASAGAQGITDSLQLAQAGFHRADKWLALLDDAVTIPPEIAGDTLPARRGNYAAYLAAMVRVSYPTACIAQMVKAGDIPLNDAARDAADRVHQFLTDHQGSFEIGLQPVVHYVAKSGIAPDSVPLDALKRLQRVYQITGSDEALAGLMTQRVHSAHDVIRQSRDAFVQAFADIVGGADQATLTYERAAQVHNTVLNVALGYATARNSFSLGSMSVESANTGPGALVIAPDPTPSGGADASGVLAYPTLESLFGSMDFCACAECRSILSPAAYLVDLLQYLDEAPSAAPGGPTPLEILLRRRPDLQHLPLTCENTNTVLPYIDVVNETLEYYVANGFSLQQKALAEYAGHDTGSVASEDLLATPQYVTDTAYDALAGAHFPSPLPFDRPLEFVRRHFDRIGLPLKRAMEQLRRNDDVERAGGDYAWRDIWMEELGLSRGEHALLTDSGAVPLARLGGFPDGTSDADVIAGLSNASAFARRLAIGYDDLFALLRTRFVNPDAALIPKLERLGVPLTALAALRDGTLPDANFDALLPQGLAAPDPAAYRIDPAAPLAGTATIRAWIRDAKVFARIAGLVTLRVAALPWKATTAYVAGACVVASTAAPDGFQYYRCLTAGASGANEPAWPRDSGTTVADGGATWICVDASNCLAFEDFVFGLSDPDKPDQAPPAAAFVRLLRLIRLWRKLGWSVAQTDAALCALFADDLAPFEGTVPDTLDKIDHGFGVALARLGILSRAIQELGLSTDRDLPSLLACWSDIDTWGDGALYARLFLNPALLDLDPVFADNGHGEYLDHEIALAEHLQAVRASLNLSADDYDAITADLKYPADAKLTLATISAIHRRAWLARKLKLSVREFLTLVRLTGLNPFTAPDLARPALLRLGRLLQAMRDHSLPSAVALYVLWDEDLSGRAAPPQAQLQALACALRADCQAIDDQLAVSDDADGDIARAQVSLVYGQQASDDLFALLDDTFEVDVPFGGASLADAVVAADARISLDPMRHRLMHQGAMTAALRDALQALPGADGDFKSAVSALFDRSEDLRKSFFLRHQDLQALPAAVATLDAGKSYAAAIDALSDEQSAALAKADPRLSYDAAAVPKALVYRGLMDTWSRDRLDKAAGSSATVAAAIASLFDQGRLARSQAVLDALKPTLTRQRKTQQVLQRLAGQARADVALARAVLAPPEDPLPLHAATDAGQAAIEDVLAVQAGGLSATFFFRATATDNVDLDEPLVPKIDYAPDSVALPNSGQAVSGVWTGHLEIAESGYHNVVVEADAGAAVHLFLRGQECALECDGTVWLNADALRFTAGEACELRLQVENVSHRLSLQWETPSRRREVIPSRRLYADGALEPCLRTCLRWLKAALLAQALGLDGDEFSHFATHADYAIGGEPWLNQLPQGAAPLPSTSATLLAVLESMLGFAGLKAMLGTDDPIVLGQLRDPVAASGPDQPALFANAGWTQPTVAALLARLGRAPQDLAHFDVFLRVMGGAALTRSTGLSIAELAPAATNLATDDTARALQAALRSRYDPDDWRVLIRPINDALRPLQRDALVAFILHDVRAHAETAHIDTPDKLFEYFLMDVQMMPVVQTSRIRHALSSVQTFIERCRLNLEPEIAVSFVGDEWSWMSRYRVWQANREVFLYPENFLESELRDDKSPGYKDVESALLQCDMTDETAGSAVGSYLSHLDELAKLEPCGIFREPARARAADVRHVIARTAGAKRKYFYRRCAGADGPWEPWDQIKLDIEDNPVLPVVWNGRLLLFWLKLLKTPGNVPSVTGVHKLPLSATQPLLGVGTLAQHKPDNLASASVDEIHGRASTVASENVRFRLQAMLCWSEYYNGKWQDPRTSDPASLLDLGLVDPMSFDRASLCMGSDESSEASLQITVSGPTGSSAFELHTTHGSPVVGATPSSPVGHLRRFLSAQTGELRASFGDSASSATPFECRLLLGQHPIAAVQPAQTTTDMWTAPFFVWDARNVFHVETVSEVATLASAQAVPPFFNSRFADVDVARRQAPLLTNPPRQENALPVGVVPGPGGVGPKAIDVMAALTAGASNVRVGLVTTDLVPFGDRLIGPLGILPNSGGH